MKRALLRTVVAAAMAVSITLPVTAQPANAADPVTVIAIIKQVYSLYQQFTSSGGSGPTLAQAIQQITTAINNAQTAIISQIDLVATASVRSCAASTVIDFADINAFSPDNLQAFARDATSCVTQANSLLTVVADKAAVDQLGFAMNTVGPLALMARVKAGLTTPELRSVLVAGNNTLIAALLPACQREDLSGGEPGAPRVYVWDCFAYNGDEGMNRQKIGAQDNATRRTSRAVAQAVLPQL
jgi:hypothetical protein